MVGNNYISQLTFLRFVAAIFVVVYHYGAYVFPFNSHYVQNIFFNGDIAVSFFFFLSGTVLTMSYWQKEVIVLRDFFLKRLSRIFPVYILAFFITIFIFYLAGALPDINNILSQALMLDAWFPEFCIKLNGPSWSISVEFFFYLLFPFCLKYFKEKSFKQMISVVLLIWGLTIVWEFRWKEILFEIFDDPYHAYVFIGAFPIFHLNTFLFGMLAGRTVLLIKDVPFSKKSPITVFFICLALLAFVLTMSPEIVRPFNRGLLCPVYFFMIVSLAMDKSVFSQYLSRPYMVYLGNISFGIYILQLPLYKIYQELLSVKNMNSLYFIGYLLCLILVSSIVYSFYENKMRDWILTFLSKKSAK